MSSLLNSFFLSFYLTAKTDFFKVLLIFCYESKFLACRCKILAKQQFNKPKTDLYLVFMNNINVP